MKRKITDSPADYIQPLNINGMEGRVLHIPAPRPGAAEILFVYGHHSSIERWWGISRFMARYAAVTMPDLPGLGGMDSFYKIGKKPSLDNFSDYLAAYIKLRYKRRRVIIVGMSFGFIVATRMLQRYPELTKKVDMLVSFAGFSHQNDFGFPKWEWLSYRLIAKTLSHRLPAVFFRRICLHPKLIRAAYRLSNNAKFRGVLGEELEEISKFEITLWHANDVRTWGYTLAEFLQVDNTQVHVDLAVNHIAIKGDHYFDNYFVEQHFRVIFNDFVLLEELDLHNHAPSVIADEKAASVFVPPKLRRVLQQYK